MDINIDYLFFTCPDMLTNTVCAHVNLNKWYTTLLLQVNQNSHGVIKSSGLQVLPI